MTEVRSSNRQTVLWLALFATIAFAVRVGIFYHAVFANDFVTFVETDAWYHMRLVDATIRHFPSRIWFDPYLVYPGGEPVNAGPFFDWIIAGIALVIGLGAPSPRMVDLVGAYVPPVIGMLTVIPIYVLGRELFSRRAGLWSAFIFAVLPGQTLLRSAIGFTDHHCAETLLTTTALMWLVLALDEARPRRWRLRMSIACGVTFGCYLLTWGGATLFVLVIVAPFAGSLFIDKLRRKASPSEIFTALAPAFIVSALMIAPWVFVRPYFAYDLSALAGGLGGLIALRAWGSATANSRNGVLVYLAGLTLLVALTVLVAWLSSNGWSGLAREIARISPWRSAGFVAEATPLLKSSARYPVPLWNEFGASLFLAMLGGILYLRKPVVLTTTRGMLLSVWTVIMFAATLGQVRFAYYLGVNAALLAGYACHELLESAGRVRVRGGLIRWAAPVALLFIVAVPSAAAIQRQWGRVTPLDDDWYDALDWLRTNSPEPFENEDAYYRSGLPEIANAHAYGVLAWWDIGYWITRIARRVPTTNPKQTNGKEVAAFLMAETPEAARAALVPLGARYVIVYTRLQLHILEPNADRDGIFVAIASWAGQPTTRYCQEYAVGSSTQILCYPEYYRTMLVRLYGFGGAAVTPTRITAIRWSDQERAGQRVLRLEQQMNFANATEAERFIASRPAERWRIASPDPLISCVSLDALGDFHPVFQSLTHQLNASGKLGPSRVQIYEYRHSRATP